MSENVDRQQEMPEEESQDDLPQNEEEWLEIKSRFEKEGFDPRLSSKQKLLHVWRWLTDAENNLNSSRIQLEKLRNQQTEELKEVETYVEHIRQLSNEKIEALESENEELHQLVDDLNAKNIDTINEEIKEMLKQAQLTEIINSSLSEQVAYLLVLRSRLVEELEAERSKNHNLTDSLKLTQFQQLLDDQKADFEDELRHQRELTKQVKEELKRTHEIEMMQMETKVETSNRLLKELEERLQEDPSVVKDKDSSQDKVKHLELAKRKLEVDNEALTYKVSELLLECEEKENHLRRLQMLNVGVKPYSRKNSVVDSPVRLMDYKYDSSEESKWSQKMKKLEREVNNLQEQLVTAGGRQEALALQYQQRRADGKSKIQKLKDVFQVKQTTFKDQINELEAAVTVLRRSLSWEKECRQKTQTDFAGLQKDKADLIIRLINNEESLREKSLQLKSVSIRLDLVEKENAKTAKEMAAIKKMLLQEALYSNKKLNNVELSKSKRSPNVSPSHLAKLHSVLVPANKDQQEVHV
ncbi:hypothetical protein CHUAL_014182 [Chamberlinius hualienensis]